MAKAINVMVALTFVAIICSAILLLSGCQKKTAATNPSAETKSESNENTKPLQAADLVGYDGTKLRKSVDQIMEAKEKRNRELEKMVEGGPDQ
jgi:PBP1b-binding outer membrane lipoprotein LpoB